MITGNGKQFFFAAEIIQEPGEEKDNQDIW